MCFEMASNHYCSASLSSLLIEFLFDFSCKISKVMSGEMAEWLKAPVLKTDKRQRFEGSNPSLSAI